MNKSLRMTAFSVALGSILGTSCLADCVVTVQVDIQNPPATESFRVPQAGEYKFFVGQDETQVTTPNGSIFILNFGKKVISSLDSTKNSFYQLHLSDYLGFGDRLPDSLSTRYEERGAVSFTPTVGQESRTINGISATPYNVDIQATLSRVPQQHSGVGSGIGRRRGGFADAGLPFDDAGYPDSQFGSTPGPGTALESAGIKIGGEVWLGPSSLTDAETEEVNLAAACVFFRGAPELRGLTDRIRKTKLLLLGGDFSVSILDENGQLPAKAPVVSLKTASMTSVVLDSSIFLIPSSYGKVNPPPFPLGGLK